MSGLRRQESPPRGTRASWGAGILGARSPERASGELCFPLTEDLHGCRAAQIMAFSARSEIIVCRTCADSAKTLPRTGRFSQSRIRRDFILRTALALKPLRAGTNPYKWQIAAISAWRAEVHRL